MFTTCSTSFTILYNLICVGKGTAVAAVGWHWAQRPYMMNMPLLLCATGTGLAICYPYSTLLLIHTFCILSPPPLPPFFCFHSKFYPHFSGRPNFVIYFTLIFEQKVRSKVRGYIMQLVHHFFGFMFSNLEHSFSKIVFEISCQNTILPHFLFDAYFKK